MPSDRINARTDRNKVRTDASIWEKPQSRREQWAFVFYFVAITGGVVSYILWSAVP